MPRRAPWEHWIAALLSGVILAGAVDLYSGVQFVHHAPALSHLWVLVQLAGATYQLTTGGLLLALRFVVPMFFGAAFGPRVGLLAGALGGPGGDTLVAAVSGSPFDWRWGAAMGLLGLLSSVVNFRTRQRYGLLTTGCLVSLVGAVAIAAAIGAWAWSAGWSLSLVPSLFIACAPSACLALLLLCLALAGYNALVSRGWGHPRA